MENTNFSTQTTAEFAHKSIAYALQFGVDKMYGDVLTILDTLNLPEKQFKAIKSLLNIRMGERYRNTADKLLQLVFDLQTEEEKTQKSKIGGTNINEGWECFMVGQNEHITGYGDIEKLGSE